MPFYGQYAGFGSGGAVAAGYTIDQSCRFNRGDNPGLTLTPSADSTTNKGSFSFWLKLTATTTGITFFDAGADGNNRWLLEYNSAKFDFSTWTSGSAKLRLTTTQVFRDPTAWMHVMGFFDSSPSTPGSSDCGLVINGTQVTVFDTESYPAQNDLVHLGSAQQHRFGHNVTSSSTNNVDAYIAELIFVSGVKAAPTDFGKTDDYGNWVPIDPTDIVATGEANGTVWFDFADSSNLGNDVSGNDNDWSESGLAADDKVLDSPTDDADNNIGNYAVFNDLHYGTNRWATFSNGNKVMDYTGTIGSNNSSAVVTIPFSISGKYYAEIDVVNITSGRCFIGTCNTLTLNDGNSQFYANNSATVQGWYMRGNPGSMIYDIDGKIYVADDGGTAYGDTYAQGDIIGIYWNQGAVYFTKNEALQNSATEAEVKAKTTTNAAATHTVDHFLGVGHCTDFTLRTDPTDWDYTPFTGFLPLCTATLPAQAIADPSAHFGAVVYTGSGSARDVTWGGKSELTADYIVIKNRDQADEWKVVNRLRGVTKELNWDSLNAESTDTDGLDDLSVTDGFGLGSGAAGYNDSTEGFVALGWAADGTTGASNTNGTITSTVSANTTAGFSIGTYTGTGSNATIGHGLSSAPDLVIVKDVTGGVRDDGWQIYHQGAITGVAAENNFLDLAGSAAASDDAIRWQDTAPTSTVFSIGTSSSVNADTDTFLFTAFHDVEGYSKFGSYEGNGNADGPFIYLGFRPALMLFKHVDGVEHWSEYDYAREPNNVQTVKLYPNEVNAQATTVQGDRLSNGFKIRSSGDQNSSSTYVFMAWAEYPFGGSGSTQARAV